jgi:hypothetical protein
MEYRLGQYECSACGYSEPAQPAPASASSSEPSRADGINRARLRVPSQSPALPAYSRIGLKEPAVESPRWSLSSEKTLYLTIFFALQIVSSLVLAFKYFGPAQVVYSLPSMLVSAVFATICVGFVLYYDSDCLRQCCLWWLVFSALFAVIAVVMAFRMSLGILIVPLVPNLLMTGWLITILMRDSRN